MYVYTRVHISTFYTYKYIYKNKVWNKYVIHIYIYINGFSSKWREQSLSITCHVPYLIMTPIWLPLTTSTLHLPYSFHSHHISIPICKENFTHNISTLSLSLTAFHRKKERKIKTHKPHISLSYLGSHKNKQDQNL